MGQTNLHRAASEGNVSMVQQLLSQDPPADVNAVDRDGWTPLHHATSRSHLYVIYALLEREETELNLLSRDGTSVVHYLSRFSMSLLNCNEKEYEATMNRLFTLIKAKGANVNFSNTNGETPLHQV
jgi:26S proteasome non-ATPase regulatory subunit 10